MSLQCGDVMNKSIGVVDLPLAAACLSRTQMMGDAKPLCYCPCYPVGRVTTVLSIPHLILQDFCPYKSDPKKFSQSQWMKVPRTVPSFFLTELDTAQGLLKKEEASLQCTLLFDVCCLRFVTGPRGIQ